MSRIGIERIISLSGNTTLLIPQPDGWPGSVAVVANRVCVNGCIDIFTISLLESAGKNFISCPARLKLTGEYILKPVSGGKCVLQTLRCLCFTLFEHVCITLRIC